MNRKELYMTFVMISNISTYIQLFLTDHIPSRYKMHWTMLFFNIIVMSITQPF